MYHSLSFHFEEVVGCMTNVQRFDDLLSEINNWDIFSGKKVPSGFGNYSGLKEVATGGFLTYLIVKGGKAEEKERSALFLCGEFLFKITHSLGPFAIESTFRRYNFSEMKEINMRYDSQEENYTVRVNLNFDDFLILPRVKAVKGDVVAFFNCLNLAVTEVSLNSPSNIEWQNLKNKMEEYLEEAQYHQYLSQKNKHKEDVEL